jgi:hypothetical protein
MARSCALGRVTLYHEKTAAMKRLGSYPSIFAGTLLAAVSCLLASPQNRDQPTVEFNVIPPSGGGNAIRLDRIEGRVTGAQPGQRIVLYAQSAGSWWIQPAATRPFTAIQPDSRWKGMTHPGNTYAALLVDSQYVPLKKIQDLPNRGGQVLAVATVIGLPPSPAKSIQFSGYPWKVREAGRSQAGQINFYNPSNVWVGPDGFLHLRVKRQDDRWTCAEVTLSRSLGFGSYRFVIRDIANLEPAAVLGIGPAAKMAIEISRWGRPEDKNGQYIIAPYTVPANTVRFVAPSGALDHLIDWEQGRVKFQTIRAASSQPVAVHTFTSGVPSPGNEGVSLNLYFFDSAANPLKHEFEVIVEKFEFLP